MKGKDRNITVIGMVLEDIFADFSKELINNVVNSIPANRNIRLVVLPGRYSNPELPDDEFRVYNDVYNSVFKLGELCDFDGFIVHIGNLSSSRRNTIADSLVADFKKVPSVFIATDIEGVDTVSYDNESGIREAVEYLVNVNGLSRLCMLGGRPDNVDSILRKQIFISCLEEYGIEFTEDNFVYTDMSVDCTAEAAELLDKNPRVQAVFCVNDAAAKALYTVMEKRGLVPGRDILVFGFDNTHMAAELIPSLSSIGCDKCTLGQRALEILLGKLSGMEGESACVATKLYGRESFYYEMYDYAAASKSSFDPLLVYRMFDDCFYRYGTAYTRREDVNLRRLFFEFMSRILSFQKRRYMSPESFNEICRLIDIFFDKGAMEYTDASKLVESMGRLQAFLNSGDISVAANVMLNRLFIRMKNRAILALSERNINQSSQIMIRRKSLHDFLITDMAGAGSDEDSTEKMLRSVSRLGLNNSAIYVFEEPVVYTGNDTVFPEHIKLYCVIKSGDMYVLAKERQSCLMSDVFTRNELSIRCKGFAAFPVFYSNRIYGILLSELKKDTFDGGEYIALQIGRSFYINDLQNELNARKHTKEEK